MPHNLGGCYDPVECGVRVVDLLVVRRSEPALDYIELYYRALKR